MRTPQARRRGFALIEVLVVVSLVTVMLGICAGMIHLLLRLDRAGRASADLAADLSRLARDFRADAHAASPLDPTAEPAGAIKFAVAGGKTVEYLIRPDDILRTLREGEKVRHYDLYRRPAKSTVAIAVTRDGSTPFASLIVDRRANGTDDSLYRDLRIDAELGKDQRLTPRAR